MKKTLFVSDLDGTLLTPNAELTSDAAARINKLTEQGVMITYATARTVRSVSFILGDVDFTNVGAAPVALMNGVLVRDMVKGEYISSAVIPHHTAEQIYAAVTQEHDLEPFIYAIDNSAPVNGDPLATYYFSLANSTMQQFMDERIERFGKPFIKITSLSETAGDIVYFAVLGDEVKIRRAAERAEKISGIQLTYYRDSYNEHVWYLEIFHESASKKHAVRFLREYTGAEHVVVFGDNLNDLPMFAEADTSVAVQNAKPEVKKAADCITDDVVAFIEEYTKNGDIE